MSIVVQEETMAALGEYAKISIAFTVRSRYVPVPVECEDRRWRLVEQSVHPPWVKDYDDGESPTRWLRWDTSNWRIFLASTGSGVVGRAVLAFDTPGAEFLEGRNDIAALWDLRVAPEWRGEGVGSRLFERAVNYARESGCVELKIETQDINVVACNFYAKQGCRLTDVISDAYPEHPDEVQLIWRLEL